MPVGVPPLSRANSVLAVELLGSTAFVRSIGLEDVNKELSCAHDTGSL